jgi:hypothetical protein
MCRKVWEEILSLAAPGHVSYGAKAGKGNPGFLDAKLFNEMILTLCREVRLEPDAGPSLFEFQ